MNKDEKITEELLEKWHKDPENWKFGIFYYNKKDKRIFPPKRNKYLGWTVNFANPLSLSVLLVFLIFIFVRVFRVL